MTDEHKTYLKNSGWWPPLSAHMIGVAPEIQAVFLHKQGRIPVRPEDRKAYLDSLERASLTEDEDLTPYRILPTSPGLPTC